MPHIGQKLQKFGEKVIAINGFDDYYNKFDCRNYWLPKLTFDYRDA
jgi:hypothetical protein